MNVKVNENIVDQYREMFGIWKQSENYPMYVLK